jgi:hypothetical protein
MKQIRFLCANLHRKLQIPSFSYNSDDRGRDFDCEMHGAVSRGNL